MFNFSSAVRSPRFLVIWYGTLLGPYGTLIAITPRSVYRLGSFFNMMRISSCDTNCTKGVHFCSAVLEKLSSKLDLSFSPRSG